ncbi:hypothetical protein PTE31013_02455 [Pandoraea terrigena]|uniref:Terminase n=1 Tax=Pandoraea terrigena TaxID=2508292 RepID=A0A5E4V7D7_9BURK|nr:hypothetical protein PTE31013_02455 [Pandoraea terrigena]
MGARRGVTFAQIERIERIFEGMGSVDEPPTFGICDMERKVLRCRDVHGELTDAQPTVLIGERLEPLLYKRRLKIVLGGRGSMKTRTIVSVLIGKAQAQRERVLCLREIQNSIEDSSKAELDGEIERRDIGGSFLTRKNSIIVPASRSRFTFRGLYRNVQSIKGFSGVTTAWIDEAENISRTSLDYLMPTIREPGSEVIISFNPNKESDPVYADLVAPYAEQLAANDGVYDSGDPDGVLIIVCNHEHNPWLPKELAIQRDQMRARDLDRYNWIWEGKFNRKSDELIFAGKFRIDTFETPASARFFFGIDWGFAQDPTTLNRMYVVGNTLYIDYEANSHAQNNGKGVDLDELWKLFAGKDRMRGTQSLQWRPEDDLKFPGVPGARVWPIKADNARPETISLVKKQGFNISAAEKWGGSVEDGITFLRGFDEIVIHKRCVNTIKEFENYSYKVDKVTGEVLPIIVDKWNHHIDGTRYAMDGYIRGRNGLNINPDAAMAAARASMAIGAH